MEKTLKRYENYLKIQGLANNTIKIYTTILIKFLKHCNNQPGECSKDQIIQFIVNRGQSRTMKQSLAALNHFFKGVLNSQIIKTIPQPKDKEFLPNILSEIEMVNVIAAIPNIKHEAIIQLMYSCALRVSEVINLKVEDIQKTTNLIKIVNAKGGKSAFVPVPVETKNLLREYYKTFKPTNYLFQGQFKQQYSASSIRKIFNKALANQKIHRRIRLHDIRHSRATHLLENGMDIKILKELLRHRKIETTERYTHLTTKTLLNSMQKADAQIKTNLTNYTFIHQLQTHQHIMA